MRIAWIILFSLFFSLKSMAMVTESKTLFVENLSPKKRWYQSSKKNETQIHNLVEYLKRSPTGVRLLKQASLKASRHGQTLWDILAPGEVSITDTTLVRRFGQDNPLEMVYETKSRVFINKDLTLMDAVLDLAHELTHYNYKEPFNPYEDGFNAREFMRSTLEGRGGEVEAYMVECKVMFELFPTYAREVSNCHRIKDPSTDKFSKTHAARLFYQLGPFFDTFNNELKEQQIDVKNIPMASNGEALFISSAYALPYPLAALREYRTIIEKVCDNDRKRLGIMKDTIGRSLASLQKSKSEILYTRMEESYNVRCRAETSQ